MGLIDFQIVFEKPMPTYFPGEVINGQLIVHLNSEKRMQCIKVRVQKSATKWGLGNFGVLVWINEPLL